MQTLKTKGLGYEQSAGHLCLQDVRQAVIGHGWMRCNPAIVQLIAAPAHDDGVHAVLNGQHLARCRAMEAVEALEHGACQALSATIKQHESDKNIKLQC